MAFFPKNIEQVDQIAAEVARDIRNQYTLGYHSTKPSTVPGFRHVEVTAKAKGMGKLTVRTRTGYYPLPAGRKKTGSIRNCILRGNGKEKRCKENGMDERRRWPLRQMPRR